VGAAAVTAARTGELLAPLYVAAARAAWEVNVAATEANERRRVDADLALADVLGDPVLFRELEAALGRGADELVERELALVQAAMLPHQVPAELRRRIIELESAVETRFVQHRGVVAGRELTDNELEGILKRSDDLAERRAAWDASKTIGALVGDDVRELARLRNEVARRLGRRDWFALSLEASEMDERRLFETLGACDAATAAPFAAWKASTDAELAARFGCEVHALRPWHYSDPFFQEVPADGGVDLDPLLAQVDVVDLARRTFDGIGLATGGILERSDLYPRPGKCQHAFCLDVDRVGDVRVLANVVPDANWASTMLHELGHAAFDLGIDPALPFLLRDCHLTLTEGVAMLLGSCPHDGGWLRTVVGVDGATVERLAPGLRVASSADRLLFTRWVLVVTHFERSLYANPDGDHDAAWWELVHRFQLVTPPEVPPADAWAAKIHIACSPVYYHTYLYGMLVAAQLRATLEREVGGLLGRPAAGALLAERVFRPGASVRWDRLLERATGEPLTVAYLTAELSG
jgi:peptidyl-dipeptidase A